MTERHDLEERIAHLTRMVEDLSDVVADQATRLDRLEPQVMQLRQRAAEAELADGTSIPLADQRPPHW